MRKAVRSDLQLEDVQVLYGDSIETARPFTGMKVHIIDAKTGEPITIATRAVIVAHPGAFCPVVGLEVRAIGEDGKQLRDGDRGKVVRYGLLDALTALQKLGGGADPTSETLNCHYTGNAEPSDGPTKADCEVRVNVSVSGTAAGVCDSVVDRATLAALNSVRKRGM